MDSRLITALRAILVLGLVILFVTPSWAAKTMDGYTLTEFGDFASNWHLVTARFRKDTSELRFTYANDVAWKALKAGVTDFPDGAVFGKIGYQTKPDPSFPSSAVPMGARRVQLMVRNKSKHAATDGWGYALFDSQGNTFPGEEKSAIQACAACHRIVPERGEVFSQIMISPFAYSPNKDASQNESWRQHLQFKDTKRKDLPLDLQKRIPEKFTVVRKLDGDMSHHLFPGTLDEIQPLLASEVLSSMKPAVLVSEGGASFSFVMPSNSEKSSCSNASHEIALHGIHTLPKTKDGDEVYESDFCQSPNK